MESKITKITAEEQLPWNKPEVQKLTVNLDTALLNVGLQSAPDLAGEG